MFALLSVWIALGTLITTIIMVVFRALRPEVDTEIVLTLLPYTVALAATLAAGVLWRLRRKEEAEPGVAAQRLQALFALILGGLTFAVLLFWLHGFVDGLLGLLVEGVFLWVVWRFYRRVVIRERD